MSELLTNLFYYNHYKPYLIDNEQSLEIPVSSHTCKISKNIMPKNDVTDFVKGFAKSVVELKEAAKNVIYGTDKILIFIESKSLEYANKQAIDIFSCFIKAFNNFRSFAEKQRHSDEMATLSREIWADISMSADFLNDAGIIVNKDGFLVFEKETLPEFTYDELATALEKSKDSAIRIYNRASGFLTKSLSTHMDFKQLDYYYSYNINSDSFKLIESGMLYNAAI